MIRLLDRWWQVAIAGIVVLLTWDYVREFPAPDAQDFLPPALPAPAPVVDADLGTTIMESGVWPRGEKSSGAGEPSSEVSTAGVNSSRGGSTNVDWRLVGVSIGGGDPFAVILYDQTTRTYFPGEQLPGGAEFVRVLPNGIEIDKSGVYESIFLYK